MKKSKQLIPNRRFKEFEGDGEWEEVQLGEISTSYSGGTPRVSNKQYYEGNIPFIRSGEIHGDKTKLLISEQAIDNSSAKIVNKGDILYALYGATSGEVSLSKIHGAINQAVLAIIPKSGYNSNFIVQSLKKDKEKILNTFLQGGQGNLSGNIIKTLRIKLPSKEEQNAIGELIQKIDNLIFIQRKKIQKIELLKQSYLSDLFPKERNRYPNRRFKEFTKPWKKQKLNEITNYLTSSLSAGESLNEGKYKLYDANGIIGYANTGQQEEYISIIKDGSGVGRVRLLPKDSSFIGTMGGILGKQKNNINYLYAFLENFDFTDYIIGATIPHVYFRDYGESENYHPCIEEQEKIGKIFKNLDAQIALEEKKLKKLEQLKQAYLNELFV